MKRNTRIVMALGAAAGIAAGTLPALAATRDVGTGPGNVFTPASLAIETGDTVRIRNTAKGFHDVRWTDRAAAELSPSTEEWSVERAFPAAGTFTYYCTIHSSGAGSGMSGEIVVAAGTSSTGTTTTGTTTTAPPSSTPAPTTTPNTLTVAIRGLPRDGRGRRVRVTITADRASTVELRLKREVGGGRLKAAGRIVLRVLEGRTARTVRRTQDGKPLPSGRFRAQVIDRETGKAQKTAVRFTVPR